MKKPRQTLFSKYFYICSAVILTSMAFLGLILMIFASQYFKQDKYNLLSNNVQRAVSFTLSNYQRNNYQYVSAQDLKSLFVLQGTSLESDIFLVDLNGNTLLCSHSDDCSHNNVPDSILTQVAATDVFTASGRLDGVYTQSHFVAAQAVRGENGHPIGYIFAAAPSHSLNIFLVSILQMFLISAAIVMLFSFIIIYFVTANMVSPLREMLAATHAFSRGDFSARVPVEGEDEVALLASAFNSMASSLAVMESSRRSFTANVSHELKTPMQTIGGFIDGILDGTIPPEKQRHYLEIVSGEIQRLSRMVRSMLSISRIEAGELTIEFVPVEVSHIVLQTMFTFEQKIEEKSLDIRGLDSDRIFCLGDADLLHQVIYNLVENAIKFVNDNGYIEFSYRVENDFTYIGIKNSGEGIAHDEIPKLFDRFYKSDKSRSLDKSGVGLGLSIVKTIVNLHEGSVVVKSEPGQYTEFIISLPTAPNTRKSRIFGKRSPRKEDVPNADFVELDTPTVSPAKEDGHNGAFRMEDAP